MTSRDSGLRQIPPLHVVTDDEVVGRSGFLAAAAGVMEAGGEDVVIHLRAPRASGRRLWETAMALRDAADRHRARLMVNDRVDVALAIGADGVQVGARGMEAADARRVIGICRFLGVSVHAADEAREALDGAPDFLLAGTIWATPSHPDRPGAGVGRIREIAALGEPVIAIGGVTAERVAEARGAGAAGIAVLRGVWDAVHPPRAVLEYLDAWKRAS